MSHAAETMLLADAQGGALGGAQIGSADLVGVTIGVLPEAPLPMPKQVLERPEGVLARLVAHLRGGARQRGLGH